MFICGIVTSAHSSGGRILGGGDEFLVELLPLAQQMWWHGREHIFKHRARVQARTLGHGAGTLRLLPALGHVRVELLGQLLMALRRPLAETNQVLFETLDRITQRPCLPVILRPVARRIVTG
jgi:hypothetical protein